MYKRLNNIIIFLKFRNTLLFRKDRQLLGSVARTIRIRSASPRTYPSFSRSLLDTSGRINGRLYLECGIRGTPSPTPTWFRWNEKGEKLISSSSTNFSSVKKNITTWFQEWKAVGTIDPNKKVFRRQNCKNRDIKSEIERRGWVHLRGNERPWLYEEHLSGDNRILFIHPTHLRICVELSHFFFLNRF